jgi:hypothetical protein
MANTIDSKLLISEIAEVTLTALKRVFLPLTAFAVSFDANLKGDDKVQVPYIPLSTAASVSRTDGADYFTLAEDTATQVREVLINRNKTKVLSYTSKERRRQPVFDPEKLGMQMADKLGYDVITDILGLVTPTNYPGDTIGTVAPADFDFDLANTLAEKCDDAFWPQGPSFRGLILNPRLSRRLAVNSVGYNIGQAGGMYAEGEVDIVAGFRRFTFPGLPANSVNLGGFAVYPSAILAGFAPVRPTEAVQAALFDYQEFVDETSGLTIQYKHMAKAFEDKEAQVFEIYYGCAKGEEAAIKPIIIE